MESVRARAPRGWVPAAVVGLVLLTALAYAPALSADFTNWDDGVYVTGNEHVRSGDLPSLFSRSTRVSANYHPLTLLSLALDHRLFGLEPAGYHAVNLLLHTINALLAFALFAALSGRVEVGLVVAYLFALHPMHVESVAWISARKDVLYGAFFLAALLSYHAYLGGLARRVPGWRRGLAYAGTALCFAASALSKPAAVVLPVVLLGMDAHRGRRIDGRALVEKVPLFAVSLWIGLETLGAQSAGGAMDEHARFGIGQRVLIACHGLAQYLARFPAPVGLSAFHPYPPGAETGLPLRYWLSPAVVAVAATAVWRLGRGRRDVLFGAGFFLVTIALVLQVVSVGAAAFAERYTYLPYLGLSLIAAHAWQALRDREPPAPAWLRRGAWILVGVYAVGLPVLTHQRARVWQDSGTLWSDAIERYPRAALPRVNRADFLRDRGRLEEALSELDLAIAGSVDYAPPLHLRGLVLLELGRAEEAVTELTRALELDPRHGSQMARAQALDRLGRWGEALADVRAAQQRGAEVPEAALARLERLAAAGPCGAAAGMELARRARQRGGRAAQRAVLEEFEARCEGPAEIRNELAYLIATGPEPRDVARALALAQQAVEGLGEHPLVLDTLAVAQAAAGQRERALETARRAVEECERMDLGPEALALLREHLSALRAGRAIRE